jgi:RNA polymerase sigma-70 factor (ECF subfamily)
MNNQGSIERFYRAHKDELLAFVSTRLQYHEDAEDLVQEAFLRLLSSVRPITEETIPSLVYTLCRHLIADWYRRHTVRIDVEHRLVRQLSGQTDSAESLLSVREITERMEQGLARLSEQCGELFRLHVYGGMQARDICKATGENYKTVEYRLGQARKEVRKQLRNVS